MAALPKTGDPVLDFALEAGPVALSPDTPEYVLKEIGRYNCFSPLREAMRKVKLESYGKIMAAIKRTVEENKILAKLPPGKTIQPDARIPVELVFELEAQEKDSWNKEMREDTLKCYPELTIDYWRRH